MVPTASMLSALAFSFVHIDTETRSVVHFLNWGGGRPALNTGHPTPVTCWPLLFGFFSLTEGAPGLLSDRVEAGGGVAGGMGKLLMRGSSSSH